MPLGTAGPIKLAEQIIMDPDDPSENILVFNGDIICNYPITELISAHICKDADVTILVCKRITIRPLKLRIHHLSALSCTMMT